MRNKNLPSGLPSKEGVAAASSPNISRRSLIISTINLSIIAASSAIIFNSRAKKLGRENKDESSPRQMPETLSNDAEIRKMIEDNFDVIAGNASLEDAKIIGIGEMHSSFARVNPYGMNDAEQKISHDGRHSISSLLDEIVKDGDHVLVEGMDRSSPDFAAGMMLPLMYHWAISIYQRKITLSGWDDLKIKDDPAMPMVEGAFLRNEKGMIPALLENAASRDGKIFIIGGAAHFARDPRIDEALQDAGIPYLLLGEKNAMDLVKNNHPDVQD